MLRVLKLLFMLRMQLTNNVSEANNVRSTNNGEAK